MMKLVQPFTEGSCNASSFFHLFSDMVCLIALVILEASLVAIEHQTYPDLMGDKGVLCNNGCGIERG